MQPELGETQIAVALIGVEQHVEQLNLTELIPCLYQRQHRCQEKTLPIPA